MVEFWVTAKRIAKLKQKDFLHYPLFNIKGELKICSYIQICPSRQNAWI